MHTIREARKHRVCQNTGLTWLSSEAVILLCFILGIECVTKEKDDSYFQCCIEDEGGPHIRPAGGVYKPLHGAVIKNYGAER